MVTKLIRFTILVLLAILTLSCARGWLNVTPFFIDYNSIVQCQDYRCFSIDIRAHLSGGGIADSLGFNHDYYYEIENVGYAIWLRNLSSANATICFYVMGLENDSLPSIKVVRDRGILAVDEILITAQAKRFVSWQESMSYSRNSRSVCNVISNSKTGFFMVTDSCTDSLVIDSIAVLVTMEYNSGYLK